MHRVFVTRPIHPAAAEALAPHCDVDIWPDRQPPTADEFRARAAGCAGVLTMLTDRVDAAFLDAVPGLRVVANYAVGFNNIDVPACRARGVAVGNTPGVLTDATADIAVTLLLAAARRLVEGVGDARAGHWRTWEPMGYLGVDLVGRTVGVVGMGRIGFATAKRLHYGWGMRVLYTARNPKPDADRELNARRVPLDELLAASDFVTVHADLNDSTRGLFDAAAFARMKPSAVFVNTSRGPVVDQAALAAALEAGTIFAAGLDVTDPEPLPPDHELYARPNCVIAPHVASATDGTRAAMARMAAANVLAALRGEPLPHGVMMRGE